VGRDAVQAKWMIQAIAALGHGLGMSTIAEGVETEAQAEMLRQAGVTEFQGYLVSRPVPSDDVEALIRRFDDLQQRTTHIFPEFNDADATLQPRVLQP
jgi:EAL domain-containing protein (putative c-di-GMP-specific phosphodiesterase class I)